MLSWIIGLISAYLTDSIPIGILINNFIQIGLLNNNIRRYLFLTLNILIYLFFGWSYLFFIKIYLLFGFVIFYFSNNIQTYIKTKDIVVNTYNKINNILCDNVKFIFGPLYNKITNTEIVQKIINYKNKIMNNDVAQLMNMQQNTYLEEDTEELDEFFNKFLKNNNDSQIDSFFANLDNDNMSFEDMFNQDKVLEMANNLRTMFGKEPLNLNDERLTPLMKLKIT